MITSRQNPKVKTLKALLSSSKERKEANVFVLESPIHIQEALSSHPDLIQEVLYVDEQHDISTLAQQHDIETTELSQDIAQHISSLKSSPGCFALLKYPKQALPDTITTALYLDDINKPSNLGAILRNAAAFNCDAIFVSPHSCDPFHPESIRASAGHYATIPIITSTLKEVTETLPNASLLFCDSNANNTVITADKSSPTILILGSENGLTKDTANLQTKENSIKIPMSDSVESLNVAVTSGILLHALYEKTTKST